MDTALVFLSDPWHAFVSLVVLVNSGAGVPQAMKIWKSRAARDVSFISWFIWWIGVFVLALYAWQNVSDPIIRTSYTLGCAVNTFVIIGILRARRFREKIELSS